MATTAKGSRRKVPAAGTAMIPTMPVTAPVAMSAEEVASHDIGRPMAAVPAISLLSAAQVSPAAIVPATPSPNPDPVADEDPAPADTAAIPADQTEDSIMDMNATIENAAETVSHQGGAMFADMSDRTKGAVEKSQKLLAEMAEFNKGTLEAMVESSKIAARGLETMGQDAAAYAKTSFEGATQAMKTFATVKSPTEFMKLQADFARSAFDALVAQTSRSTEASLKLAGEVAQPISNRVALAADKIKVAA